MAMARLQIITADRCVRLVVGGELPDAEPFDGPRDRDWANVRKADGTILYEWRTTSDRITELAQDVAAGRREMSEALAHDKLGDCVEELREFFLEDDEENEFDSEDAQTKHIIEELASGFLFSSHWAETGGFGYAEDGDAHMSDAVRALDLPAWATVEFLHEGGPGTGYTQPVIVLEAPNDAASFIEHFAGLDRHERERRPNPFRRITPRDILERAYRETDYVVDDGVRFTIRVGERCSEVDMLLEAHGAQSYAFLTAHNPGSQELEPAENDARQDELREDLRRRGFPCFRGEGRGRDGRWEPEESVLVVGVTKDGAAKLARAFDQVAFVHGVRGAAAELVFSED